MRQNSIDEIRLRLVAAHLSNDADELNKVLKTDCTIEIAKKLANADDKAFFSFYRDDSGAIPEQIRFVVSRIIVADDVLGRKVQQMLRNADQYVLYLQAWFS